MDGSIIQQHIAIKEIKMEATTENKPSAKDLADIIKIGEKMDAKQGEWAKSEGITQEELQAGKSDKLRDAEGNKVETLPTQIDIECVETVRNALHMSLQQSVTQFMGALQLDIQQEKNVDISKMLQHYLAEFSSALNASLHNNAIDFTKELKKHGKKLLQEQKNDQLQEKTEKTNE